MTDRYDDRFKGSASEDRGQLAAILTPGTLAQVEDQVPRWRDSLARRTDDQLLTELRGLAAAGAVRPRVQEILDHRRHAVCAVLQQRGVSFE